VIIPEEAKNLLTEALMLRGYSENDPGIAEAWSRWDINAEEFLRKDDKEIIPELIAPNRAWFKKLISGKPHMIIGDEDDIYLKRWYLIPRNRRCNIYLHHFLRSDDDRAPHDHPWPFWSVILTKGYLEHVYAHHIKIYSKQRRKFSVAYREPTHTHIVELNRGPCWTIIITGANVRQWGFYCLRGWIPWYQFTEQTQGGNKRGNGCGEYDALPAVYGTQPKGYF